MSRYKRSLTKSSIELKTLPVFHHTSSYIQHVPGSSILTPSQQGTLLSDIDEEMGSDRQSGPSGVQFEMPIIRIGASETPISQVASPATRLPPTATQIMSQLAGLPGWLIEVPETSEWTLQLSVPLNAWEGEALFSEFVAGSVGPESDDDRFEDVPSF